MNRPATLDGSLLARKGDAAPAIASDSPLLEELGEPRPDQRGGRSTSDKTAVGDPGAVLGLIGNALDWLARHPVYGVLGLAVGVAILFTVTIAALTPSTDPMSSESPAVAPEKITLPADEKSMTEASDAVAAAATNPPETAVAPPAPPAAIMPPAPPAPARPAATKAPAAPPAKKAAVAPAVKRPATPAPSAQSGRYLLQLSAVTSARAARLELARLERRLGKLLGKRKIVVVKAVPPGKPPVYRLRASAYNTRAAARAACSKIRKRKMACWVVPR